MQNMDESQKPCGEGKKPNTKVYVLHTFIYMKFFKNANQRYGDRNQNSDCL